MCMLMHLLVYCKVNNIYIYIYIIIAILALVLANTCQSLYMESKLKHYKMVNIPVPVVNDKDTQKDFTK